jgi:hypothetical protein
LDELETLLGGPPRQLPPLVPEELTLVYHPLPDGWLALGASGDHSVKAVRFSLRDEEWALPERLAEVLIEPFHQAILASERVRVLSYGALREVDFHALPFADSVLIEARPVVYGLDTDPLGADSSAPTSALVVVDPRGDLAGARKEGGLVVEGLEAMLPGRVDPASG